MWFFKKKEVDPVYYEELLDCPRCKVKMSKLKKNDVIIDICNKCGGMWVDPGEIGKLKDLAGNAEAVINEAKAKSAEIVKNVDDKAVEQKNSDADVQVQKKADDKKPDEKKVDVKKADAKKPDVKIENKIDNLSADVKPGNIEPVDSNISQSAGKSKDVEKSKVKPTVKKAVKKKVSKK